MKAVLRVMLGAFLVAPPAFATGQARDMNVSQECEVSILRSGGVDPFPIRSALPIPWNQIEGSWTRIGLQGYQVQIKILRETESGVRFVHLKYVDPILGTLIAQGVGVVRPGQRIISALVRGAKGDFTRVKIAAILPSPQLQECGDIPLLVMYLSDPKSGSDQQGVPERAQPLKKLHAPIYFLGRD